MLTATALNPLTWPTYAQAIAPHYINFQQEEAKALYAWTAEPVDWDVLCEAMASGACYGFCIDTAESLVGKGPIAGFVLYKVEPHQAIEIQLVYQTPEHRASNTLKSFTDCWVRAAFEHWNTLPQWQVLSYAMLGVQAEAIKTLCWYGFQPVGQAIVRFDFSDSIGVQIAHQQAKALPPDYTCQSWQSITQNQPTLDAYAGANLAIANLLYEGFHQATDALWDPRFRSVTGVQGVLDQLLQGQFGQHLPACTQVLCYQNTPVGVCFMVQGQGYQGNIPLITVAHSHQGKGLSKLLLRETVMGAVAAMVEARIDLLSIDATLDTENGPAIHMYRSVGFREVTHYPHAFLKRPRFEQTWAQLQQGQWCQPA